MSESKTHPSRARSATRCARFSRPRCPTTSSTWITGKILYPLPHRQYVFTLPKMLRAYFRFDRKLSGKLSQCTYQSLKEFFQTTLNRKEAMPRVVISIQTFGDLVNLKTILPLMKQGWRKRLARRKADSQ